MLSESSRNHLNFKIYVQIGKFLGVTPIGSNITSIIFPLILMISVFGVLILSIVRKLKSDWDKPPTVMVLDVLESCYECCFLISITGSAILNLKNWNIFLNVFTPRELKNKNKYRLWFDVKLLIFIVVFFIIHYSSFQVWNDLFKKFQFHSFLHILTNIYECFYLLLIWQILIILKEKYKNINSHLEYNLCKHLDKETTWKRIVETGNMYRANANIIKSFNSIFGWSLFWFFASTMVNILYCINLIMLKFPLNLTDYKNLLLICYTCFYTVSMFNYV